MMSLRTSWFRSLLLVLATIGVAVATSGCDWANVGGPW
jgi:hypothetical protein